MDEVNLATAADYAIRNRVEGWLDPAAAQITVEVARNIDIIGRATCEIGVHHGKYAILLGLLTGGRLVGFDLFERQSENIDNSGSGDRRIFLQNSTNFGIKSENVNAITINSNDLSFNDVIDYCGDRPVLFSIDGAHTEYATQNDLSIAAESLASDGVVMLDDVFNPNFPGVASGLFLFLNKYPDKLHPFCIGGGKLFFAGSEATARMLRAALDVWTPEGRWLRGRRFVSQFCGSDVVVFSRSPSVRTMRQRITSTSAWQGVRETPMGLAIRRTYAASRYWRVRVSGLMTKNAGKPSPTKEPR